MKFKVFLLLLFCSFTVSGFIFSQTPEVPTFKLFLIGDAGEGDTTGATLHDLHIQLLNNPNSAVVFLGDNCYVRTNWFLPLEVGGYDGSNTAKHRIMAQLNILRGYKGSAFFVPGNHDWWNHINLKQGKKRLLAEQKFIQDTLRKFETIKNHDEGTFLPENGEAGPISKDFNDGKTRVIFLDSYRMIIEEGRKGADDSLYRASFYNELKAQLTDATKKKEKIIVVAHHPIHAKGKHSLPLVLLERINRRAADSNTNYPPYNRMATHLDSLLKEHHHPDIYYVAGHEHSLEYFFNDSLHYLVSGAGSRVDQVKYKAVANPEEYTIWNETVLMYHRVDNKSELQIHCLAGCD